MKDFFDMTRHERRGTIVLLALIAAVMVATLCMRSCTATGVKSSYTSEMQNFEDEIDSSRVTVRPSTGRRVKNEGGQRHVKKKKKSSRNPKQPDRQPRRLDPVPQF